jgi:hypothetical protein
MPISMPEMLRPRHELPTPAFRVFCALLLVGLVVAAARALL